MKLYIKKQMLSVVASYDIYDNNGNQKYDVECDFSHMRSCNVYENKKKFGYIEQKNKILPEFVFYLDGEEIGNIEKDFSIFQKVYNLNLYDWKLKVMY